MITLNRIGNKLGAALIGILVCAGMLVDQQLTQHKVADAILRADTGEPDRKHVIEAKTDLGDMRLAKRGIQIAKSPAEAAAWQSHPDQAKALLAAHLQDALSVGFQTQPSRSGFGTIQQAAEEYADAVREFTGLQTKILEANNKRIAIAAAWAKSLDGLRNSAVVTGSSRRTDVEDHLARADGDFAAMRDAAWRFVATSDTSLRDTIDNSAKRVEAQLAIAHGAVSDEGVNAGFSELAAALKDYVEAAQLGVSSQGDMANAMMLPHRPGG